MCLSWHQRLPVLLSCRLAIVGSQSSAEWWNDLAATAPAGLAGLWFGLVELGAGGWHIYVAGTSEFDGDDEVADWAVGPYAWWPDDRYLPLPVAAGDPAAAVDDAAAFVRALRPWEHVQVTGVATGFDDGDFEVVYRS